MDAWCRIELLGGLQVWQAGRLISRFQTHKTGALLAYLAYYRHRSHAREELIEILWPEDDLPRARHKLSMALSSLRRQLEPPGISAGAVIRTNQATVQLNPALCTTDVAEFEAKLEAAATATSDFRRAQLRSEALEQYRGPLLPAFEESWVETERQRLAEAYREALDGWDLYQTAGSGASIPTSPERLCPEAPALSGTVTVLVMEIDTDLHRPGSTSASRSGIGEVSRERLRSLFRCYGGHDIPLAPGTLAVVFERAGEALAAAMAGLKAVQSSEFRDQVRRRTNRCPVPDTQNPEPAPVRMAIHTGEIEVTETMASSEVLRHAGRLLRAAPAGQVLLTEGTAGLVRHVLSDGARLTDLGLYRLQDRASPERLFRVETAPTMTPVPPHPVAAPAFDAQLPPQGSRFFGREEEIARLREMLSIDRLVTVTGPGGSGKTRLVLEVAGRLQSPFHGAVWFVPLADLAGTSLVAGKLRETLRLPHTAEEPLEQVAAFLSPQPSLLILDNFEHLLPTGTVLVRQLLEHVPQLTLLITSRQCLGAAGERELPLGPLPIPLHGNAGNSLAPEAALAFPSVQLFVDRAQAILPDFQVTRSNVSAMAELCRRLDGLPLALELAAARARELTPAQMVVRLTERFQLLAARKRSAEPRHHSLWAAIEWSYHLLSPELQRFFAGLSVFRGGWTLEASEAVCREALALEYLIQLQECSLVLAEGGSRSGAQGTGGKCEPEDLWPPEMRYRMLETLREFAAAQLSPEERASRRQCHAEHYLAWAERAEPELFGPDQAWWLDQLEGEHDNFRTALTWAVESGSVAIGLRLGAALFWFWLLRGFVAEGRERLQQVLDMARGAGHSLEQARALFGAAVLVHGAGEFRRAEVFYRESLRIGRDRTHIPDSQERARQRVIAGALNGLGQVVQARGKYRTARVLYQTGLTISRGIDDRQGVAAALNDLGKLALKQRDLTAAGELLAECLALTRERGDTWRLAWVLNDLGLVAAAQGQYESAEALLNESLALRRNMHAVPYISTSLNYLGDVAYQRGDYDQAGACYRESLALQQELQDRLSTAWALEGWAAVAEIRGHPAPAARLAAAADALRTVIAAARPATEEERFQHHVAAARASLGEEAFAAAWAKGRAMTLDQAVVAALEESAVSTSGRTGP
jgi:predicted ATPase